VYAHAKTTTQTQDSADNAQKKNYRTISQRKSKELQLLIKSFTLILELLNEKIYKKRMHHVISWIFFDMKEINYISYLISFLKHLQLHCY